MNVDRIHSIYGNKGGFDGNSDSFYFVWWSFCLSLCVRLWGKKMSTFYGGQFVIWEIWKVLEY